MSRMVPLRVNVSWMDQALCREHDPELFFPIGDGIRAQEQKDEAKQVCAQCPVRAKCFEWARGQALSYGVFAGFDEDERREANRLVSSA